MTNFLLFFSALIILNSFRSARNFIKFYNVYRNLKFYNFNKHGKMLIANERANNEFIIFSDWHYKVSESNFLHFDVWCLVDLHELYWLIKINRYFNSKPISIS
jgi:rRNA maturation protein Rpf1